MTNQRNGAVGGVGAGSAAAGDSGLVDALVQVSFVTTAAMTRVGAEHDLSLTQLRVLGILRGRRLRMAALADHLGLERSTLSGLVERAERRGLVARAPSPGDGRAVDVFLTAAGDELGREVVGQLAAELTPLTGALDDVRCDELRGLLETMLGAAAG